MTTTQTTTTRVSVKRLAVIAVLLGAVGIGCAGGDDDVSTSRTERDTTTAPTGEPTVEGQAPAAPPAPAPDPAKMSLAEFNQLHPGMTYADAVAVIGGEGTVVTQSEMAGYHTIMFSWEGEGGLGANANVMFQNDELINKAQFGLE